MTAVVEAVAPSRSGPPDRSVGRAAPETVRVALDGVHSVHAGGKPDAGADANIGHGTRRSRPGGARSAARLRQDRWKARHAGLEHFALVLLAKWGVIGRDGSRFVLPAATSRGIWLYWIATKPALPDDEAFKRYRRIKCMLKAMDEPDPEFAVKAFIELIKPLPPSSRGLRRTLGKRQPALDDNLRTAMRLAGTAPKAESTREAGTLEQLLGLLPEDTRERFATHLAQARHPAIIPPHPFHVGRILRLRGKPMGLVGALNLIDDCASRRSLSTQRAHVGLAERADAIIGPEGQADTATVTAALDDYVAKRTMVLDTECARVRTAMGYSAALDAAERLLELVLGPDATSVAAMLPARHDRQADFVAALRPACRRQETAATATREADVLAIVPRLLTIEAGLENRVHQLEALLDACMAQLPSAREKLAAGLDAGFTYTGPVVRADGSLGHGEQTVSCRFMTEAALFERAAARDSDNVSLRQNLPRRGTGRGGFSGLNHKADRWSRIHIVYEGTLPVTEGGEVAEPFFLDMLRFGVLEADGYLPDGLKAERRRRLAKICVHDHAPVEGLLTFPKSKRAVARYARGSDPATGDIMIPLVELYHAMAYARIALRYGVRWGARFAEIMQIRLGGECFRKHRVDGRWMPYLALKPKGWLEEGKFGIDLGTLKAIQSVKRFTHVRWHAGLLNEKGSPTLPSVPFGEANRRGDLPPARYLFQTRSRALSPREMTVFMRVLLSGIIDMRSHDGRYVFATMLGLNGTGYGNIGQLLHHTPGSAMPAKYDLSNLILSDDAAEQYNQQREAGLLGLIADG